MRTLRTLRFNHQLIFEIYLHSIDPFPGKSFSPPLPKEELLDRYHSHTKKCASCRGALANLQKLRMGVAGLTVLVWGLLPLLMFVDDQQNIFTVGFLSLVVVGGAGIWFGLGRLEKRFYQGRLIPPRNLPDNG
ncbi:MAG: hypothetical protein VKL60_18205 [Sphaerospermopsis sp.]|nr:hypothetical protein [Sphaerospermopsis sp.]